MFATSPDLPELPHPALLSRRQRKRLCHAARPDFWSHPLGAWRLPMLILGFIAWWPVGLALLTLFLAWRPAMVFRIGWSPTLRLPRAGTGNTAFDAHRSAVLARLEEERRQLDTQQAAFADFLQQLRRAKDQEEFDRFMAARSPKG